MKGRIEKIKLSNRLYLYRPKDAPLYKLKPPEEMEQINKKLNDPLRVAQKKREFLKKALK